jgi:putative hydrolase of the HAD superfamily
MIRAFALDAVGTLIHPEPPAWIVYADVGQRFGSRLGVEEIRTRFRTAFARQERLDYECKLRTSEERELRRWRAIVAEVLYDATDSEACFAALYEHFRHPQAWRLISEAAGVIFELKRRGYPLALASNYDQRLRSVAAGMPGLQAIDELVISSEVGWRKPALPFFEAVCQQLRTPAEAVLFIGDDCDNDFDGARRAGLRALLYDPERRSLDIGAERIGTLEELLEPGRLIRSIMT